MQTLRIKGSHVRVLPEHLSNLINLRHIHINHPGDYIRETPKNMGRFTCLQTLNFFCVGRDEGYRMKELGPLKNLRGEKNIYCLEMVEDEEEPKSAKLKEKEIFKLGLHWSYDREEDIYYDKDEKVLEGL